MKLLRLRLTAQPLDFLNLLTQGAGVPEAARRVTAASNGKYALVASLWKAADSSWLDGPGCNQCNLDTASFTISILSAAVHTTEQAISHQTLPAGAAEATAGPKACAEWCDGWVCDGTWCANGSVPDECATCKKESAAVLAMAPRGGAAEVAVAPAVTAPTSGGYSGTLSAYAAYRQSHG